MNTSKKPISRENLIGYLKRLHGDNPEQDHIKADDLLLEYINDPDISEAFNGVTRRYS